ncbi:MULTISPECIES: LuxR family transcriptional regulator [unclassified Bradyrhizobium]|uniref:helix-turn-helix transcriptional regulator n=1 Tax=unclassified Bradyrhizobium TaxID=2631580 RepID=UPI0020B19064|nr:MULTISPECIES: LuxR family transcriptional regulator [unclassified Bradyrhizobium]MCP3396931.1 LuxR family transcriptional regulator [Bradyrhizobium sp. CCGB20]MCP3405447.1 LuxR family transcriptional regulator [Bradyrhizobium sp. CCGB01]
MNLFSFVECANQTQSLKALFDLLVSCASQEGFTEVAYGALTFAEPLRLAGCPPPLVAMKAPPDWCQRYLERKYYTIDPVVRRTPMFAAPFLWDELARVYQLQTCERRVLQEAREAGLKNGVSVPLFGPSGRISVMSFASLFDDADLQRNVRRLNTLAWHFHIAFAEIAKPSDCPSERKVDLSKREKDCLRWVAEGKSSWEIGKILSVSENTVNFHVKNAIRKLGTANRTQGLVKAIRLGLIEFSEHASATSMVA